MPRLIVEAPGGRKELVLTSRLVAGRADECEVVLDDHRCSRHHCEVVKEEGRWVLRDLGSSNGTFINGKRIEEQVLEDGDHIRIGAIKGEYTDRESDFSLQFISGEHVGTDFPLPSRRVTFGRKPSNDIRFDDIKISGVHLEIVQEGEHHVLRDLGSTNGTLLDGRKIDEVALTSGDKVMVGDSEFLYLDLRSDKQPSANGEEPAPTLKSSKLTAQGSSKRRVGGAVVLVALLGIVGAGVWFRFFYSSASSAPTSGRAVADAPPGTLLEGDWSFEDRAAVADLWNDLGETSFSAQRGPAASGSMALTAEPENDEVAIAVRSASSITPTQGMAVRGAWSVEGRCLASVAVRFLASADEEGRTTAPLTTVLAQSSGTGGEFVSFEGLASPPSWATAAEILVTARGSGAVRVDDLSATRAPKPGTDTKLGDLFLVDRGGSFGLEFHRAQFVELFSAWGSPREQEEGERLDLPPGTFAMTCRREGDTIYCRSGQDGPAPEALTAYVYPEVAVAGTTLLLKDNSARHSGSFDVQDVQAILLGSAAERMELSLDPPCRVSAVPRGDGLQLRLYAQESLTVKVRTDFSAEATEANRLLIEAQNHLRDDQLGAAWTKLQEIRRRLPYQQTTLNRVNALLVELRQTLDKSREHIVAEADVAQFLDSLERYRKVVDLADALLVQLEGAPELSEDLEQRTASMREHADSLAAQRREEEAQRLLRLVQFYESLEEEDRSQTAAELRKALLSSYADTEAARLASGNLEGNL